MKQCNPELKKLISSAPQVPGVYQYKTADGSMLYIGKARVLRSRLKSYVAGYGTDWKATSLLDAAATIEWVTTESELAAMLLEARLIQSYQPPFNVLLKTGQPYTYFLITNDAIPQFLLVRNKQRKGTYFGPFIEKMAARKAHRFLQETFALQLCNKKIPGGCLAYHMKRCAGMCRPDFDADGYRQRISLVRRALRSTKAAMITELDEQIATANQEMLFERSAQLTTYRQALSTMYESLAAQFDRPTSLQRLADRDVWLWHAARDEQSFGYLFLFRERQGVMTKARVFCLLGEPGSPALLGEYLSSYYRLYRPAPQVLVSDAIEQPGLLAAFVASWHTLSYEVTIDAPARDTHHELMLFAKAQAHHEREKTQQVGRHVRQMLKLGVTPRRIDCFDISHKQGHAMVGACVRFLNGRPDHKNVRNFHIKTLSGQNDYAALQEIVQRRYADPTQLPDMIVIDGGKGQLSAVREVIGHLVDEAGVELVSLAKREETIFSAQFPEGKVLNQKSVPAQMLIALRDYAHHRAISFHRATVSRSSLLS